MISAFWFAPAVLTTLTLYRIAWLILSPFGRDSRSSLEASLRALDNLFEAAVWAMLLVLGWATLFLVLWLRS